MTSGKKLKMLIVFGTRPECIKCAPVISILRNCPFFELTVCSTGQHREMLQQVLSVFNITVDHDLDIMMKNQTLAQLNSLALNKVDQLLTDLEPDCMLVQGDTTTAMAAAMAAFYRRIPIIHLEAGLRSFDMNHPWPEEFNRRTIGSVASLHLAPTRNAEDNLLKEGVAADRIAVIGNTVIDALMLIEKYLSDNPEYVSTLDAKFDFLDSNKKLILVTGHRRENWGDKQGDIFLAIKTLVQENNIQVVYPLHLNPVVMEKAQSILDGVVNVFLTKPVDYIEMVYLLKRSYFIITDSGGIQEEAPSFGKPVLVTRDVTERVEGIAAGTACLVGSDINTIVSSANKLLHCDDSYQKMSKAMNPYGDGTASLQLSKILQATVIGSKTNAKNTA